MAFLLLHNYTDFIINPKVNNKMQIGYALNSTLYNTQRALRNDFQKERNINQYHYEFDKSYEKEE
ncbi:hypothetical protein APV84_13925 [Staphylococcus aureus]|nr:hypothetical protein APV84_13925 [Staphylococcus aureus]